MSNKKSNQYIIFLIIAFFGSCIVRSILSVYTGVINIIYDELIYWDISKSIFYDGNIMVRGATYFGKEIAYPLLISLANLVDNNSDAVYIGILIINSAVMSSVIFPSFLLANKLLNSKRKALGIAIFSIIIPEMFYSTRLLQENLYYPIIMWIFVFFVCVLLEDKKNLVKNILFAVLLCLLTYIKSIGLCIFAGALFYYLLVIIRASCFQKKIRYLVCLLDFILTFLISKIVLDYVIKIVFRQNGENASSSLIATALDNLLNIYNWKNYIYPVLFYFVLLVLIWGIFTVIIPVCSYKQFDSNTRLFFCFIVGSILATIAVICLLILDADNDLGSLSLRFHLRYLFYFFVPIIILFFKSYSAILLASKRILMILCLVYIIFIAVIPLNIAVGSEIDCIQTNTLRLFLSTTQKTLLLKSLIIILMLLGMFFLYKKKTKSLYILTVSILLVLTMHSSQSAYRISYGEKIALQSMNEDGKNINSFFADQDLNINDILIVAESNASTGVLEVHLDCSYRVCTRADYNEYIIERQDYNSLPFYSTGIYTLNGYNPPKYVIAQGEFLDDNYNEINLDLVNVKLYKYRG